MKLMSVEMWKQKRLLKSGKKQMASKKTEYRLLLELTEKLSLHLKNNDKVMFEVNPKVLVEFVNILSEKVLSMYDYEQVDNNKFIFYNKEIEI